MMSMDQDVRANAKRPYATPVLVGLDLFGAEASVGSCCRTSMATCSVATRTGMVSVDGAKVQATTNS